MLGVLLKTTTSVGGAISVEVEIERCSLEEAQKYAPAAIASDVARREYNEVREDLVTHSLSARDQARKAKRKTVVGETKTSDKERYLWLPFELMTTVAEFEIPGCDYDEDDVP